MTQKISVGIDLGTNTTKVIVAEATKEDEFFKPKIVGYSCVETKGLRHGYITNIEEASRTIRQAVNLAQKSSGYKIDRAFFSLGGIGIESFQFSSEYTISDKTSVISQNDIEKALEQVEDNLPQEFLMNREIIHAIPISFKIDGKAVHGKPLGMTGITLGPKVVFITTISQHSRDLIMAAEKAGIEIEDIVAGPVAASISLLNKSQKIAGCAIMIIGGETVGLSVYENGNPVSLEVFPIGSSDITNDIALGFKVSLDEAERIKTTRPESLPYPRRKIEEIIGARLEDILDLVQGHLKRLGKQGLLPAGILITGSGACVSFIDDLAKQKLKLPAKKIGIKFEGETKIPIRDGSWPVAYGLAILGISENSNDMNLGTKIVIKTGDIGKKISDFFKKLMP